MIAAGLALLGVGVVLAEPVSRTLARAAWPHRAPAAALLLWQCLGLVAGLSFIAAGVVLALAAPPVAAVMIWAFTGVLTTRLLGVLVGTGLRTLAARHRHRQLLDLIATPWPNSFGAAVLDHPTPVAYCLPGLRSRLVVSRGALDVLSPPQLAAVLAHEHAHLSERHDVVVLPFVAWGATLPVWIRPWLPGMLRAQYAVAELVELRADDVAARHRGAEHLAAALRTLSGGTDADADVYPHTNGYSDTDTAGQIAETTQSRAQRCEAVSASARLRRLASSSGSNSDHSSLPSATG
ncbi:MAG: M56 family metallopeptidase [Mycobacteriales bacterium]